MMVVGVMVVGMVRDQVVVQMMVVGVVLILLLV